MNGLSGLAPDYHTMCAALLAGLPHGAYFGIAMLVAHRWFRRTSAPPPWPRAARPDIATTIASRWPRCRASDRLALASRS